MSLQQQSSFVNQIAKKSMVYKIKQLFNLIIRLTSKEITYSIFAHIHCHCYNKIQGKPKIVFLFCFVF